MMHVERLRSIGGRLINYDRMDRSLSGWKDRNADFMWMRPEMNWERHAGGRGLAMLFSAKVASSVQQSYIVIFYLNSAIIITIP